MKTGLCLSGGGVKGAAHIGVLKALEEAKIKVDCISGTSSGSIVASMYAMGYTPDEILQLFQTYGKQISRMNFKIIMKLLWGLVARRKIVIEGLHTGNELAKIIEQQAKNKKIDTIQQIQMPLIIPSVNLYSGEIYLFSSVKNKRKYSDNIKVVNNITVGKAVQCSCSYPGVFAPAEFNHQKMVDGGVRENTPWKQLKEIGAEKIISVTFEQERKIKKEVNMLDCILDSMGILMHELYLYEVEGMDFVLEIKTKPTSLLDMTKITELYNLGYKTARENMKSIKGYLNN